MPSIPGKHPRVTLGQASTKEQKRSGHAVHKAGTHSETELAGIEGGAEKVKRAAHKAPSKLPKKGGA